MEVDDVDEIINIYVDLKGDKFGDDIKHYIALFMRNIIRFINAEVYTKEIMKVNTYRTKCAGGITNSR